MVTKAKPTNGEPIFSGSGSLSLQQFASPLVAKNKFVKASIGGFAGSGKTETATRFIIGCYKDMKIEKPLLIIDNEKGSRFLVPKFTQAGIKTYVKDTVQLADVLAAIELLNQGEIGCLFVDTLTKVWYKYIRDYRTANGHFTGDGKTKRFITLQDWGKILPAWQEEFSDRFVACEGNFVFTGRGGFQYEKEEDEKNEAGEVTHKGQFVKSGVKMKLAGETPFEPDLNIWMEQQQDIVGGDLKVWREAQIMKDRSGVIDGKVFKNPTYKDFQPFIKFLLDVPVGIVAGETNTENLAPSEDHGFYARKQQRDIELEKIKAEFDKSGIGTSREEKQIKATIYSRIFGTTSMTEFEKMSNEKIALCRQELEEFFKHWKDVVPEEKLTYAESYDLQFVTQKAISDPPDFLKPPKANGEALAPAPVEKNSDGLFGDEGEPEKEQDIFHKLCDEAEKMQKLPKGKMAVEFPAWVASVRANKAAFDKKQIAFMEALHIKLREIIKEKV